MRNLVPSLMLLIFTLSMVVLVHNVKLAEAGIVGFEVQKKLQEDAVTMQFGQLQIIKRPATTHDLELILETGTFDESEDYNQLIDGHGTGLRPPPWEEWTEMVQKTYIVEEVRLMEANETSSSVDHSTSPWFPPIGNQDGEGSCVAWAVGYYTKTFQEAKEHGWNLSAAQWLGGYTGYPTPEYQDRIMSPDFIYHLINWGEDGGATFYHAINLVCSIGVSSWKEMPYRPNDHTSWPSEDAWREAALYRGSDMGLEDLILATDEDLLSLKNWLAAENLAVIAVDANDYYGLTANDVWTVDNYVDPVLNHANTIVGYDDNFTFVEEGEMRQGAFKIANSWGVGSWENVPDGCYWISYRTMKQVVEYCMFFQDRVGYEPELSASFKVNHTMRGECNITIGMGSTGSPAVTKWFNEYIMGGTRPFPNGNIVVDITEFKQAVPRIYEQWFILRVYDDDETPATGVIERFAVQTESSRDVPLSTLNGQNVFVQLRLLKCQDLDADGEVSISDIFGVAVAYGSYIGHPNWNEMADINGDEEVDIIDIFYVAMNFGKTYP